MALSQELGTDMLNEDTERFHRCHSIVRNAELLPLTAILNRLIALSDGELPDGNFVRCNNDPEDIDGFTIVDPDPVEFTQDFNPDPVEFTQDFV